MAMIGSSANRDRDAAVAGGGAERATTAPRPSPPFQVLLTARDLGQRRRLLDALGGGAFEVITAGDGADAIALARALAPDLVLLEGDPASVGRHDLDTCRALRALPALESVPVVLIGAFADEAVIDAGFAAGATDLIPTPFDPRLIRHRLRFIAATGRMERALRAAKERADAANLAKANFIATMSHELRTPLNAVIGFSDVILSEAMGPIGTAAYREYIGDIRRSGKHLLDLISDILEWSKLEVGETRLRREPVALDALVESCARMIAPLASQRGVQVSWAAAPLTLETDQRSIRQILINLLSNAVKFTAAGRAVRIDARALAANRVGISVSDEGIGIPKDKLADVTRPFFQVDDGTNRAHEGVGLGLAIAARLAALLGGRLEIESELGRGTRVSIVLPVVLEDGETPPA
jgi:signal transduction histidine kinase